MYDFTTHDIELDLLDGCPEVGTLSNKQCIQQKVRMRWSLELELREWGVKGLCIHVPDQEIEFEIDILDAEGDVSDTQTITAKVTNCKVDEPPVIAESGTICPQTLQYYKGEWTLVF